MGCPPRLPVNDEDDSRGTVDAYEQYHSAPATIRAHTGEISYRDARLNSQRRAQ
ncbi:MAG TPA: hypothetical protein VE967_18635 [Gemmatimonadaceae bacterium]|nr:hypothetical protein [Gemmatimonadaceae bacterium]